MKKFTTTAIALALTASTAAFAGEMKSGDAAALSNVSADKTEVMAGEQDMANLIRTRDITGGAVYVMDENAGMWNPDMTYDAVGTDWNQVGEIEDIILSKDGEMKGFIAEIGGFLDIGDKHVMIPLDDVSLVAVDDRSYAYVTRLTEEQLEKLESVDEGFWN
ncbi:MAG: PRC-barrel domain-containing protein [Paracoccaceae bacterium]